MIKNKWCGRIEQNILWTVLGFVIGMLFISFLLDFETKSIEIIKALGSLMIVASLGVAINQFRLNRKQFENSNAWNKKQLAMTQAHNSLANINKHIKVINPILHFRERKDDGVIPYEVYEIHNAMGVFLEAGDFVFHGEHDKHKYKDLPKISLHENHINDFIDDLDGLAIKDSIYGLLNEYEYLSAGVNNGILDKDVIKSLLHSPMRDTFKLFEKYIDHVIETHQGSQTMYSEIKKLIK